MDCVVDHPKPGDPSYDLWIKVCLSVHIQTTLYIRHKQEKTDVLAELKKRAQLVTKSYNQIEGVKCQEVQGAMYAFPRVFLPEKAIAEAKV